jgi:hypothetical protein
LQLFFGEKKNESGSKVYIGGTFIFSSEVTFSSSTAVTMLLITTFSLQKSSFTSFSLSGVVIKLLFSVAVSGYDGIIDEGTSIP